MLSRHMTVSIVSESVSGRMHNMKPVSMLMPTSSSLVLTNKALVT